MSRPGRRAVIAGVVLIAGLIAGAAADRAVGWVTPAFDAIAHLFYEVPVLAKWRRPTQLILVRWHLAIWVGLVAAGLIASPRLGAHWRRWWAAFCLGYAVRAVIWVAGGNLPLVPGDSCHYLEVATSVYRGEGPVKHYVESFFADYPRIRQGRGVLDDWATPLWAYVLAGAYRITGIEPGRSLEETVCVAKGASFALNLLCLPALYGFGRRRFGPEAGLGAMAALAALPVHALYAGFALRESLVALTSILAVWWLTEVWHASGAARWGWALAAGVTGGLAILARNTAMALMAAAGLYALAVHGRRHPGPLLAWGLALTATIAPWAWATLQEYGEPFYTYTKFFPYNFSWAVHHYDRGHTRAAEFFTAENMPTIARVKVKSLLIIAAYSTMILGLPLVLGFVRRLRRPVAEGRGVDRLVLLIGAAFVLGTLANVADVTQVAQLGRYYLPLYCLALPSAVAGLGAWAAERVDPRGWPALAATLVALLWADPTWAYDATWLVKPYQLHWPALRDAGDWVKGHPEAVPADARIMTWFPWEFRVASDRTTVLLPRSLEGGAYELRRIEETIRRYGVTHILWGSFEPAPHPEPESLGRYLEGLRLSLGLTEARELYRSPPPLPYPVRLYRLSGGTP
jgi:hypothetical protein